MKYENTDGNGRVLRIEPSNVPDTTRFIVVNEMEETMTVLHANRTAPDAAAAILKAQNVAPVLNAKPSTVKDHLECALFHLHSAHNARQLEDAQERERNRLKRIEGGLTSLLEDEDAICIPQHVLDKMVQWVADTYEKGQKKTTADRVAFGEAEPGQETLWTTPQGFVLEHDGYRWCLVDVGGVVSHRYTEWEEIPRHYFPATAGTLASRRLLNHLDEEPERDTIWDTADKFKLWHGGASWLLSNEHGEVVGRFDWGRLPATVFPLRETVQTQRVVRHMGELTEEDRGLQWRDSRGLQWAYDRNNQWWHYWSVPDSAHHQSTPTNFPWREVVSS